jgi:hypothetical protein
VPILSICDEQLEELALRKKAISYRIAVQRAQLRHEMLQLRHPLQSFERIRAAGAGLARHAVFIAMAVAPVAFLLRRPLVGGIAMAVRLARKGARWWAFWKVASRFLAHAPKLARSR